MPAVHFAEVFSVHACYAWRQRYAKRTEFTIIYSVYSFSVFETVSLKELKKLFQEQFETANTLPGSDQSATFQLQSEEVFGHV